MDLPDISILNYFNKVLISLADLSPSGDVCPLNSLIAQCEAVAIGGQIVDYAAIVQHCHYSGFIQLKKENVTISALGQKFLD